MSCGKLVEPVLAKHAAHRGHPWILRRRPPLAFRGALLHRPELVDAERLPAEVLLAAVIPAEVHPAVNPDARLAVEDRPAGGQLDRHRNEEHQRGSDHQADRRNHDVEPAAVHARAGTDLRDQSRPSGCLRLLRRLAATL